MPRAASPESKLQNMQRIIETLFKQGSDELAQEVADTFSADLDSIFASTVTERYRSEPVGGLWPIGPTSFIRRTHPIRMTHKEIGPGAQSEPLGKKTELALTWIPRRLRSPWSAVITQRQPNPDQTTISVEVKKPGLPLRRFAYPPAQQNPIPAELT